MRPTAPGRGQFRVYRPLATRWADNDVYGHVNNVIYYSYFDTLVNGYLVDSGLLDIACGANICLVVSSACDYFAPLAFPHSIEGGLRVDHLGTSAITYGIGIFAAGAPQAAAAGTFTHVLVDRASRRPVPLPTAWTTALQQIRVA